MQKTGPLSGVKVVEIAGIGPAPHCGMMLADMGAEVILVERKGTNPNAAPLNDTDKNAFFKRGKRSVVMNLKNPDAIEAVLDLVKNSDALIGVSPRRYGTAWLGARYLFGTQSGAGLWPNDGMGANRSTIAGRRA